MLFSVLKVMIIAAFAQQVQPAIMQVSTGWCSPNIANVVGNVTVRCIGVDPRALVQLNLLLNRSNLDKAAKIREANEWATKYKELEKQLAQSGDDILLTNRALEYLHRGKLEKAGSILDQLIAGEEKGIDRTAANYYNRALIYDLQGEPLQALAHYEKAVTYRPDNPEYESAYGIALFDQNDYQKAELTLNKAVGIYRELAQKNPQEKFPNAAVTLNYLAIMYFNTNQTDKAIENGQDEVKILRDLAKTNPQVYLVKLANALNTLGNLYMDIPPDIRATREAFTEAIQIYRELAKSNPKVYSSYVASTQNALDFVNREWEHRAQD